MLSVPDFKEKKIIMALLIRGEKLSFKNDNIIIKNKDGEIRHQSSCHRLFAVFIIGHTSITTGLLQRAKKFGFSIILMSYGLIPYGSWLVKAEGNLLLRQKQYEYDNLSIAQHILANKISEQVATLKHKRNKTKSLKTDIAKISGYNSRLPDDKLDNLKQLLGLEGSASRLYFKQMFSDMNWQGRKPRAKRDITNLLLDIGYTQLFHIIDAMLNLYGFDTYKGVYHQPFYQRKSLVSDLVEPFRTIVDQAVRNAYKLGQIKAEDFDYINGQYRIFGKQAQGYSAITLKALVEQKDEMFIYIQQYYRAFMRDKPANEFPVYRRLSSN